MEKKYNFIKTASIIFIIQILNNVEGDASFQEPTNTPLGSVTLETIEDEFSKFIEDVGGINYKNDPDFTNRLGRSRTERQARFRRPHAIRTLAPITIPQFQPRRPHHRLKRPNNNRFPTRPPFSHINKYTTRFPAVTRLPTSTAFQVFHSHELKKEPQSNDPTEVHFDDEQSSYTDIGPTHQDEQHVFEVPKVTSTRHPKVPQKSPNRPIHPLQRPSSSRPNQPQGGSQSGCSYNGNTYQSGNQWFSKGCQRHTCIHFRGRYFVETDSCDTDIYNTTYKCIVHADTSANYPDCCPRYTCNPDNLGNRI